MSDGGITLSFVNRGIPIHEEDRERIFERYWRSASAKMHVQQGTGIGLALVKAFADRYGGIEVRSDPIQGTQDYVTEFKLLIRGKEW